MAVCKIDDCPKPAKGRGMCGTHYERWRRHGDTATRLKSGRPPKPKKPCGIPDCDRPQSSRGWCHTHYVAWQRYGNPLGSKHPPLVPAPAVTPDLSGFLAARRARLARTRTKAA